MVTRKEQKEIMMEKIILTALALFVHKGYAATKTSEISKAVGISEGLLFHYFKSKEVLLETLVNIAQQVNDGWLDEEELSPLAYFKKIADQILYALKEDSATAKFFVLIAQLKQSEGIPEHIMKPIRETESKQGDIEAIVIRGQKLKELKQGNPKALMHLFSDVCQAVAIHHAYDPDYPLPESEWIIDVIKHHEGEAI